MLLASFSRAIAHFLLRCSISAASFSRAGPDCLAASSLSLWYSSPAALALDSILAISLSQYSFILSPTVFSAGSWATTCAVIPDDTIARVANTRD